MESTTFTSDKGSISVHNPVRGEFETMEQYKLRRQMSQRLAHRGTLLSGAGESTSKARSAPRAKAARRTLVGTVGIRQAKKALRKAGANHV